MINKISRMALSTGFFKQLNQLHKDFTPVLKIESKGEYGWYLFDGESSREYCFNADSGPSENFGPGARIILLDHCMSTNKYKKFGIVNRFFVNN